MRNCVLLDFDGTITTKDTTKFLLVELLKQSPCRFFFLILLILKMLCSSNISYRQICKNKMIGYLISGYKRDQLQSALERYKKKVEPLFRNLLINKIRETNHNKDLAVVVTASPTFVVSFCMTDLPVIVIGTEFKMNGVFYSGELDGNNCFGYEKVKKVKKLIKSLSLQINIKESWSDNFSDYPMMKMANHRYWIGDFRLKNQVNKIDPDGRFILDE
ncbi:MAG: hypothetical protein CMF41_00910 [Legionellales bacterium]|nr:hypothetical protein [Legionellales bacterium]OUX66225.1 MAG: hypothetical protein CBE41_00530 [Gammaproteobacteria bacterium TMED281]